MLCDVTHESRKVFDIRKVAVPVEEIDFNLA